MFRDFKISKSLGKPLPTSPELIIEYMRSQSLDFDPGSRYAYSNFGYLLLGRIIEKISGKLYADFVKTSVLESVGISDMRLGHSLLEQAMPAEVSYDDPLRRMVPSVMGKAGPKRVLLQYGGWNLECMDAHGGWLASAVDLVRFASAFDAPARSPLLDEEWINATWARPEGEKTNSTFDGLGWQMRIVDDAGHFNSWHNGSLDGSNTLLVRRFDGLNWAVLLNKRAEVPGVPDYLNELDRAMHKAANTVTNWPSHDLFAKVIDQ
jgi:N-acyl-D-amino-acid deacylase